MNHPIINAQEALACGITPSQLRATANSLERIARRGYSLEENAYSSDTMRNAFTLRRVAKELSR